MKKYIVLTTYSYDGDYNAYPFDNAEDANSKLDELVNAEMDILKSEDTEEVELVEFGNDNKEIRHPDGDMEIFRIIAIEL